MNIDAFRCAWRGIQLSTINKRDSEALKAINLRYEGNQRALLLLHGFSSSPAVYRQLLPSLSGYDAIVCPVLPGHANTLDSFAKTKAGDWLSAVEKSYEILANEFEKVDVLGLSLGGLLACHLSQKFALNHLYLLAPALNLYLGLNRWLFLARSLNWLGFSQVRASAGNLYTKRNCEIAYRQLPIPSVIEILSLIKEFKFSPPSCPTDLFLGSHDNVVDSKLVAERFANLDNVTIHWLKNSAHVIPLDGDLDVIVECMRENLGVPVTK